MKHTEMVDAINEWCDKRLECPREDEYYNCPIDELCEKCSGNFIDHPALTAAAYDVITNDDMVNHPPHYTQGGMECIDEMILIFGKNAVRYFCLCNAWKYRKRALYKNGEEDLKKSDWYIKKYEELCATTEGFLR